MVVSVEELRFASESLIKESSTPHCVLCLPLVPVAHPFPLCLVRVEPLPGVFPVPQQLSRFYTFTQGIIYPFSPDFASVRGELLLLFLHFSRASPFLHIPPPCSHLTSSSSSPPPSSSPRSSSSLLFSYSLFLSSPTRSQQSA